VREEEEGVVVVVTDCEREKCKREMFLSWLVNYSLITWLCWSTLPFVLVCHVREGGGRIGKL
jgi:hypothetical protein